MTCALSFSLTRSLPSILSCVCWCVAGGGQREGVDGNQVEGGEEEKDQDGEEAQDGGGLSEETGQSPERQWRADRPADRDRRQTPEK